MQMVADRKKMWPKVWRISGSAWYCSSLATSGNEQQLNVNWFGVLIKINDLSKLNNMLRLYIILCFHHCHSCENDKKNSVHKTKTKSWKNYAASLFGCFSAGLFDDSGYILCACFSLYAAMHFGMSFGRNRKKLIHSFTSAIHGNRVFNDLRKTCKIQKLSHYIHSMCSCIYSFQ